MRHHWYSSLCAKHDRAQIFLIMTITGDGGDPTYTVAKALAAPFLTVPIGPGVLIPGVNVEVPPHLDRYKSTAAAALSELGGEGPSAVKEGRERARGSTPKHGQGMHHQQQQEHSKVSLPRSAVMLIGGDLAYPNPSRETFEQRLFVPFQDALPPPPHYHPGKTRTEPETSVAMLAVYGGLGPQYMT